MQGGDLYSALQSNVQGIGVAHPLSWWRGGRNIALDIARGLHFLHSEHVVRFLAFLINCAAFSFSGSCVLAHLRESAGRKQQQQSRGAILWLLWSMVVVAKQFARKLVCSSGMPYLRLLVADVLLVLLQVHNDLKTKNILLSDNYATAKIGVSPVDTRSLLRLCYD